MSDAVAGALARTALLGVAAMAIPSARAVAQVVVTPFAGVYLAGNQLYRDGGPADEARQRAAPVGGIRLTLSGSGVLGIEGSVAYAPSDLRLSTAAGDDEVDASLLLASLRVVLIVNSVWAPVNLYLAGGGALVRRGGRAFEGAADVSTIGGDVAVGVLLRMGSRVRLRIEVEDMISAPSITFPGAAPTVARTQHDFLLGAGVSIPLGL